MINLSGSIGKNVRNSNYELMRITSMFLIVVWHIICHGHVIDNCSNSCLKIIIQFIYFFAVVHVNSFILLSGYFQSKSTFKQSKMWSILNANWFYRVVILFFLILIGLFSESKAVVIREILPININQYWFVQCYVLLYCISPFINNYIINLSKKNYQKLLIVLFIVFSIIPTFTGNNFLSNNGHTFYQFIYLYLVGAYLREYPLSKCYLFKNMSKNMYQVTLLFILFSCLIVNYFSYYFFSSILNFNSVTKEFASYFVNSSTTYSNPLVVFQSIAYFSFFGTLVFKNKFINKCASLTLGVYLIHDNDFVRRYLYRILKISGVTIKSYKFVFYMVIVAIVIYITCSVIEYIRQILFKFIYDLSISKKIRDRYYKFINGLYLKKDENC